jgi:hypothetical protein
MTAVCAGSVQDLTSTQLLRVPGHYPQHSRQPGCPCCPPRPPKHTTVVLQAVLMASPALRPEHDTTCNTSRHSRVPPPGHPTTSAAPAECCSVADSFDNSRQPTLPKTQHTAWTPCAAPHPTTADPQHHTVELQAVLMTPSAAMPTRATTLPETQQTLCTPCAAPTPPTHPTAHYCCVAGSVHNLISTGLRGRLTLPTTQQTAWTSLLPHPPPTTVPHNTRRATRTLSVLLCAVVGKTAGHYITTEQTFPSRPPSCCPSCPGTPFAPNAQHRVPPMQNTWP